MIVFIRSSATLNQTVRLGSADQMSIKALTVLPFSLYFGVILSRAGQYDIHRHCDIRLYVLISPHHDMV